MKLSLSGFFQLRVNVLLFRRLPASVCYHLMQAIGRLYYLIKRKEKRLIERNIGDMLGDKPERYVNRIRRQTFKGIFAHYYEKMYSAFKDIEQIRRFVNKQFDIQNEHVINEALAKGKGVILVTAHWGAVEFIPWMLALRKYPTSVILECQTAHLEHALRDKAKRLGAELITCTGCASVFRKALRSLSQNRMLMTECDEVDSWRRRRGHTIDLFGKKLFFDNTLDILAARSGSPVVGVFLRRVSRNSYTLICESISGSRPDGSSARGALDLWQKYVTEYPEQWYQWKKWAAMKAAS